MRSLAFIVHLAADELVRAMAVTALVCLLCSDVIPRLFCHSVPFRRAHCSRSCCNWCRFAARFLSLFSLLGDSATRQCLKHEPHADSGLFRLLLDCARQHPLDFGLPLCWLLFTETQLPVSGGR